MGAVLGEAKVILVYLHVPGLRSVLGTLIHHELYGRANLLESPFQVLTELRSKSPLHKVR